ncbi:hypothetical protein K439DRAFT_1287368, partial [Ramaria rubella]
VSTTWLIRPVSKLKFEWEAKHGNMVHKCLYSDVILSMGEHPGFYCGSRGSRLQDVRPLPDI